MSPALMTDWWAKYLTLEYEASGRDLSGVDCWGLVYLIYSQELKVSLPRYDVISADDAMAAVNTMDDAILKGPWRPIEHGFEQPFDVARIRRPALVQGSLKRVQWHVGVITRPGHLLHIEAMPGVLEVAFRDELTFRHHYNMPPRDVMLFRHESQADAQRAEVAA
jgi:probable lipoprotein NlpC